MADREKAINEIQWFLTARPVVSSEERYDQFCEGLRDALELLKEQQHQIWEMQDRTEYLEDKLKSQPQIVRCKDCKHFNFFAGCKRYLLSPNMDWFCADGEANADG